MNKKYIISWVAAVVVVAAGATYWTMSSSVANDDYTCYNYSVSKGSCEYNQSDCGAWSNGKRTCNWVRVDTYNRGSSYRCGNSWSESRTQYTKNASCSVVETDTVSPEVVEGWVE